MAELRDIDLSAIEPLKRNPELQRCLDEKVREYFKTYSISLEDRVTDRLAEALAEAVSKLLPDRLNNIRVTQLLFGKPPAYVFPAGVGHAIFVPNMSLSPIATTWGPCIYLDAHKLASFSEPFDLAAVVMLEEFVHSLFGVGEESMAKQLTCSLFSGIYWAHDGYRMERQQGPEVSHQAGPRG